LLDKARSYTFSLEVEAMSTGNVRAVRCTEKLGKPSSYKKKECQDSMISCLYVSYPSNFTVSWG